ncbi:helix-turn-helix transcriptional regulator [Enterococcus faecalis]|uniref:helix-turn-helix transcriptional regulator n=1 Tax=Enterococcus faecalis TaxID=1351 RepID=UPI0015724112|nr:helix-turn-helix transcriptional regulator [Enterococcus faecalis]EHD7926733.1 helix-turn-helix transcriptional regulator [Enterococcus faecalis]EKR9292378.1 helix-turn-helix transcriptional regulator [Enterococcus faecalis]EKZ0208390.1 helix-turn-helix transcriptional regulator [Enterococcus faecalis]MEB7790522.1 helix-turn-helix domain-containing protein [Enterococcus faecalis]MEB7808892.1 helix-turn-helix domain-containing protein [Enterococcus faecalis]
MFSKNLKYLREKYNLEQIELAEKLNRKSASSISEWEKGKYTPKIGTLNDIAELFNVSITDLMNKDLSSNDNSNSKLDINPVFSKLNEENKREVYNLAEKRLNEQNSNVSAFPHHKEISQQVDLAAHSEIDNREYSDEQIKGIRSYLDQFIDE